MTVDTLELRDFKIHRSASLRFAGGLNYLVGGNGAGKTSILEAIHYLCVGKGFSTTPDADNVRFGERAFDIQGDIDAAALHQTRVRFDAEEGKRRYFEDGKEIAKLADLFGKYPLVLLTPDDLALTHGYATDRRRFFDAVIAQSSKTYLNVWTRYNRAAKQRSALLSSLKERFNPRLEDELDAWSERIVEDGVELIRRRRRFVEEFTPYVERAYRETMLDEEKPSIAYRTFDVPDEGIVDEFRRRLDEAREDERRRAQNLVGPHRDDYEFGAGGLPLRRFGSQGQHKTFQVALRFAQFFFLKERLGRTPVFLLDDVFGELDKTRAARISAYLKRVGQAFVTLTDLADFSFLETDENDRVVVVEKGAATAVSER